ncbi:MAG: type II toxin-antitoxin system HicA family toxin, partial [Lachnospiraceae bacterium]|nr:type II toxin-antitoxin system HicA family toxin [Lachnospiraceae bacterium]
RILTENGCFLVGHGASHDKWQSSLNGRFFFVPRHPSKEVKKGTVRNILKQAGIQD